MAQLMERHERMSHLIAPPKHLSGDLQKLFAVIGSRPEGKELVVPGVVNSLKDVLGYAFCMSLRKVTPLNEIGALSRSHSQRIRTSIR